MVSHRSSVGVMVVGLVFAVMAPVPGLARVQGVKGRRLQVFASLEPYVKGIVLVEEPSIVGTRHDDGLAAQATKWGMQEFLQTRLSELPWLVRPWYDELGPAESYATHGPVLIVSSVVHGGGAVALELFGRDAVTGEVVLRYTGFGRALIRRGWAGERDDLQEITRVLVDELAAELDVPAPPHLGGYEPDPYRRRSTTHLTYPQIEEGSSPRVMLHGEPPVQLDAPVPVRFRNTADEEHRSHFATLPPVASRASVPPTPDDGTARAAAAAMRPEGFERPARVSEKPAAASPSGALPSPSAPALDPGTTVYTWPGTTTYHLESHCSAMPSSAPRRLSLAMAESEKLSPCRTCTARPGSR